MFSSLTLLFITLFIELFMFPNSNSGAELGHPEMPPSAFNVKIFSSQSLQNVPPLINPVSNLE